MPRRRSVATVRPRVRLVHWNAAEAAERAARLAAAGYVVDHAPIEPAALKALRARPPAAAVIDLSRLPSQGRDVGVWLRKQRPTRHVPLVFVGGDATKVARVRQLLPDASYTTWARLPGTLKRAIAAPPARPTVPASTLAGYSGTPLPKKLGIKPGNVVALVGAPEGFERTLGALPPAATLTRRAGSAELTIWFVRTLRQLHDRIDRVAARMGDGLWIAWPKKASGVKSDVSETDVRRVGLAHGLVDYKICAIDATWSGLKFARRR